MNAAVQGLHKEEIHGEKYLPIFDRLASLGHNERIKATYFDGLETPLDMSNRVVRVVQEAHTPGGCVLLVTHSTIIESVLAVLFGKRYDGISMRRLAWLQCSLGTPEGDLELVVSDGVTYSDRLSMK